MCAHPERERASKRVCVCLCVRADARLSTTDNPANESSASVTLRGALFAGSLDSSVDREREREETSVGGCVVNTAAVRHRDVHVNPFSRQTSNRV